MLFSSSGKIELPSMPGTLARIIQITNSPTSTSEQLGRAVRLDQSLATKVLRLANSAFIGRTVKVGTITEAIVTLGFSSIRNLAASASVVDALFPKKMFPGFSWRDMWTHSTICAVSSQAIYARLHGSRDADVETAFVAGLLHDVGKLVVARALPHRFLQVVQACTDYGFQMCKAENNILGTTHCGIGGDLAGQWGFPDKLAAGIAYHHTPEDAGEHEDMARTVFAANMLAKRLGKPYILGVPVEISLGDVAEAAELTVEDMQIVVEHVRDDLARCEEIMSWGDQMPGESKAA